MSGKLTVVADLISETGFLESSNRVKDLPSTVHFRRRGIACAMVFCSFCKTMGIQQN